MKYEFGASYETPINGFEVCKKIGEDKFLVRFKGCLSLLADKFAAIGLIGRMHQDGEDVYVIINEADFWRLEEEDYNFNND